VEATRLLPKSCFSVRVLSRQSFGVTRFSVTRFRVMSIVLGVSCFFHDSAVALLRDGEVLFAAQEERYRRIKNYPDFPALALRNALDVTGLRRSDLDAVAYYENPWRKYARVLRGQLEHPTGFGDFAATFDRWAQRNLDLDAWLRRGLAPEFTGRVFFADHHASHAASAFYPSGFESAAILVLDAVGEWASSSLGVGAHGRVRMLEEQRFPNSLGMLYSALTQYLGFSVNEGEYKVMGLAPFGTPSLSERIEAEVVQIGRDGAITLNPECFDFFRGSGMTTAKLHAVLGGEPRKPDARIEQRHMDVAASLQAVCEKIVCAAARHAREATGESRLVLAGGVALNCVANGKLQREGIFEEVWVQPAAGDAGGALGAALVAWHEMYEPRVDGPPPPRSSARTASLFGQSFTTAEVKALLRGMGAVFDAIPDEVELLDRVARLLADGRVIGWFYSRTEFGPRALGARSIVADPRPLEMQSRINRSVKFRESFRPFAPSVLEEHAASYFEIPGAVSESPYMLFTYPVRERWRQPPGEESQAANEDLLLRLSARRSLMQAVTHMDYSARIQTVDEARHGRYYRLIRRFWELTGCPMVVNTSFNVKGEPIVNTPEDAFHCFMKTELDYLIMEHVIVDRRAQPSGLKQHIQEDY